MNKKILFLGLLSSTLLFSGCIQIPEKEVGIEPIFIEEGEKLEEIPDFEKISETETSTSAMADTGETIPEDVSFSDTTETIETPEESGTSATADTGEIISEENSLILEGESEIISKENSEEEILTSTSATADTGETISEETGTSATADTSENL